MKSCRLVCMGTLLAVSACGSTDETDSNSEDVTSVSRPRRWVPGGLSTQKNNALWAQYCVGDAAVTQRPIPNYDNSLVMSAATALSKVSGHSFAIYGGISKHHKTTRPAELESVVSEKAHEFLGYLCGEFRDRAKLIETKLTWVAEMNYLTDDGATDFDPSKAPFKQMRQSEYGPYLVIAKEIFTAKQADLVAQGKQTFTLGTRTIDTPVPPSTVCETKYIFSEYLRKGKTFDDLATFQAGYETYKSQCQSGDEDYYYDFRGDSNIKPNSPESNGMIWIAQTITNQCLANTEAPYAGVNAQSTISPEVCRTYFSYPFNSRFNGARAGLAAWVLIDPTAEGLDSQSSMTIVPRAVSDETYLFGDKGPYKALNEAGEAIALLTGWEAGYNKKGKDADIGLATVLGGDKEKIETVLQLAVDRHTDWYQSKYDDQMAYKAKRVDQAYSPFVASSYEMCASDAFVTPGYTATSSDPTAEQYKHWMFVFKVHKDNWYTPARLASEPTVKIDFDRMWFDETSFGDSDLANSEHAWDRLGSPLEGEYDTILYLHNIPAGGLCDH